MDIGPDLTQAVWCFTWGQPREEVFDAFMHLLAGGDHAWVIVPIPVEE